MANIFIEHFQLDENTLTMDRETLFKLWSCKLTERLMRIFVYEDVDPILAKQIEKKFIIHGKCGIIKDNGKLVVVQASPCGTTAYEDEWTTFVYTFPTMNKKAGKAEIGKTGVLANANTVRNPMIGFVRYYAFMLTTVDLTLQMLLINLRAPALFAASNEKVASNITAWYKSLARGSVMGVVTEETMEAILDGNDKLRGIPMELPKTLSVSDCWELREKILKSFYSDIGVKVTEEKKERMITDEITSDTGMLMYNIDDMLESRKQMCKDVKKVFGFDWNVRINPAFQQVTFKDNSMEKEGVEDGDIG